MAARDLVALLTINEGDATKYTSIFGLVGYVQMGYIVGCRYNAVWCIMIWILNKINRVMAVSRCNTLIHIHEINSWLLVISCCSQWLTTLLTHLGRPTHICVGILTIIGSDNGLSPGRRQAIIWTYDGILFIRALGTNFSEMLGKIHSFSFKKMHLKMSSAKWRLFLLGLNVLILNGLMLWPWHLNGSSNDEWGACYP